MFMRHFAAAAAMILVSGCTGLGGGPLNLLSFVDRTFLMDDAAMLSSAQPGVGVQISVDQMLASVRENDEGEGDDPAPSEIASPSDVGDAPAEEEEFDREAFERASQEFDHAQKEAFRTAPLEFLIPPPSVKGAILDEQLLIQVGFFLAAVKDAPTERVTVSTLKSSDPTSVAYQRAITAAGLLRRSGYLVRFEPSDLLEPGFVRLTMGEAV